MKDTKKTKARFKLYTDGSIDAKTLVGAYGWVLIKKVGEEDQLVEENVLTEQKTTISVMEIRAVLEGLKSIVKQSEGIQTVIVDVYSDSKMLVDSMNVYIPKWRKKAIGNGIWTATNGQPVANQDLLKEILEVAAQISEVRYIHVKAHADSEYNNRIDKLVHSAAFGKELEAA